MIVADTSLLIPLLRTNYQGIVTEADVVRIPRLVEKEIRDMCPDCAKALDACIKAKTIIVENPHKDVVDQARLLDQDIRLGLVDCLGLAWAKALGEELAAEDRGILTAAARYGVDAAGIAAHILSWHESGHITMKQVTKIALDVQLDGDHDWDARDAKMLGL